MQQPNTKTDKLVIAINKKKYGAGILAAILVCGSFYIGTSMKMTSAGDSEISQNYYAVIQQSVSLEQSGGMIHKEVEKAMKDEKVSYAEYGLILEKVESFLQDRQASKLALGRAKSDIISRLSTQPMLQQQQQQQVASSYQQVAPVQSVERNAYGLNATLP